MIATSLSLPQVTVGFHRLGQTALAVYEQFKNKDAGERKTEGYQALFKALRDELKANGVPNPSSGKFEM